MNSDMLPRVGKSDGLWRQLPPIEYQGKQAILASFVDTARCKQAEELFRSITSSLSVGVCIVQEGKFQFANLKFLQFVGCGEGEVLGADVRSFVFPENKPVVRESAVRMLKGEHLSPYEYRTMNKIREMRWVMETFLVMEL